MKKKKQRLRYDDDGADVPSSFMMPNNGPTNPYLLGGQENITITLELALVGHVGWFSHQQCSMLLPTCEIDHGGQRRVLGWVGTGLALIKRAVWGGQFGHAQYAMSWTKLLRFQFRGEERKITKKLHNLKVIFKLNETLFNNGTLRNLTVFSA